MTESAKYDVAISFLAADEPTARDMATRLEESLSVFFFPRKQEQLAGTDGLESMRTPFLEARVVVVLYRHPWGETPWTRVEQTAITDRCLKQGWDSLLFVTLDSTSPVPAWLPDTRIRFNMETYGVEQAVGAVKFRVQQMGGVISPPSPLARAARVKEGIVLKQDQERLFRDLTWVEDTAHPAIVDLMKRIVNQAERIRSETDLLIESGYELYQGGFRCVLRYGRVTLEIWWQQHYRNVIEDVKLECTEYNARLHLFRERAVMVREPQSLGRKSYRPALNFARELRWVDAAKRDQLLSNDDMVQRVLDQLLALLERLNQGKIPRYEY